MTNKELDYEALSTLNIRVETLASNGFTQETALTVAVTDVGGASAWVPSLIQSMYAREALPETAEYSTIPAALLLLGLLLLAARQRRAGVRYKAIRLGRGRIVVATPAANPGAMVVAGLSYNDLSY